MRRLINEKCPKIGALLKVLLKKGQNVYRLEDQLNWNNFFDYNIWYVTEPNKKGG